MLEVDNDERDRRLRLLDLEIERLVLQNESMILDLYNAYRKSGFVVDDYPVWRDKVMEDLLGK